MTDLTLRHELDCRHGETYWQKCVFDAEYNRTAPLLQKSSNSRSYELIEEKDVGDTVIRRVKAEPETGNLPAAIKKVLGDSFGYVEEGTFDKKARRYAFKTIPAATFADKIKIEGSMTCEPLGDKRVTRVQRRSTST